MKHPDPKHRAGWLACLLALTLPLLALPALGENPGVLAGSIARILDTSPEIQAARAAVEAAQASLSGAGLPLNNPELEAEAENTDVNTLRIGISQTIDWHDKRGAFEQVARLELERTRQALEALRLEKSRDLLDAMGRILVLRRIDDLARERVELLQRFEKLVKRRYRAGDLSSNDLALARLSLAEAEMLRARRRVELIQAGIDFQTISGQPLDDGLRLPDLDGRRLPAGPVDELARNHPSVRAALIEARVARARVEATDRGRKADPTFGLAGGREDRDALVALSFSLPLQIRNDFQGEVDAARAEANRAEQLAQQRFRAIRARLIGSREQYATLARGWALWRKGGQGSIRRRAQLLEKLWQAGETSTTDYLLQLQQTLDVRITGIEFEGDLWSAWIDALEASGKLLEWLNEQ